jgi:hypothetical protein
LARRDALSVGSLRDERETNNSRCPQKNFTH